MSPPPPSITETRTVSSPHRKLIRLCETAAARGGDLTTFTAVAKLLELTPARVTQLFGIGQEAKRTVIQAGTLGRLVAIFAADGVCCELAWLYLDFADFAARLEKANPVASGPRHPTAAEAPSAVWERTEATALPGLVELRLHPPRPGNEVPDSFYVDTTLLFGTAYPDYDPEDGQDPRTIAIALRKAFLAIGSDSYSPLPDSMIGERTDSAHYRRVAGGVEVTGPAPDGTLNGSPIGDQYLAVIAGTNAGDAPFAVTVAANWGAFVVTDADVPAEHDGSDAPSRNKSAILNALIYKHARKDELGRPLLARATLRRRPDASDLP